MRVIPPDLEDTAKPRGVSTMRVSSYSRSSYRHRPFIIRGWRRLPLREANDAA